MTSTSLRHAKTETLPRAGQDMAPEPYEQVAFA